MGLNELTSDDGQSIQPHFQVNGGIFREEITIYRNTFKNQLMLPSLDLATFGLLKRALKLT